MSHNIKVWLIRGLALCIAFLACVSFVHWDDVGGGGPVWVFQYRAGALAFGALEIAAAVFLFLYSNSIRRRNREQV